ncbi:GRAM domain-containing protein 4 [Halocaridina rubra]|uniref:GRAM domain-containing protein 4 n=1 Tax=Halocaridina rubra TaxID=373956 RepID=A0AAN8XTU1_HALRR
MPLLAPRGGLEPGYLCFERSKSHAVKNLKLSLKDVRLEKANSYPWIPGGGMAIEVSLEGSGKGYFFAGILNRDEVFDGIIDACKKLGATWCDAVQSLDKPKDPRESKEGKENKEAKETKELKEAKDK